jgi:aspartyl-tRNA(Asn)/glutamyl-tRNA(Gln) amidotransferase subunit A
MKRKIDEVLSALIGNAASNKPVTVPFSEERFDPTGIEAARATINEQLFVDVDLIVLPTLVDPVPRIEKARRDGAQAVSPANTFFANYFGLPAVSIPIKVDPQVGPIALQIVGPIGADTRVLEFATRMQKQYRPMLARP